MATATTAMMAAAMKVEIMKAAVVIVAGAADFMVVAA
jgi:hypothetical protein